MIMQGIILVTPQSAARIAGLSVAQRMIFALERAGVRSITLVPKTAADRVVAPLLTRSGETHVRWNTPEELPGTITGNVSLFLRPVVVDSAAIDALNDLDVAANSVLAIDTVDRSERTIATGAYLMTGDAAAHVPGFVVDAIGGSIGNSAEVRARLSAGVCYPLGAAGDVRASQAAEKALLESLRKRTDGFFAYWFDRRISTAISRHLVNTGVTPNQITVFTLFPALAAALLIAIPDNLISCLGALLFWASTILDGCDGEVARLKYLESENGAFLDLMCDNVGHVALFIGIVVHVYLDAPGAGLLYAGVAIVAGTVVATIFHYLLITRPKMKHGGDATPSMPDEIRREELYERLASRDFAYLLPILAVTGTLHWFVWATAFGVNLFWIALVTIVVRKWAANLLPVKTGQMS
jgi:phosphatidylglycerophosphate synthase